MDLIDRILEKVVSAAHTLGTLALAFVFLSVVADVIARLFGANLGVWVEELSGYGVTWSTYLGLAYVLREGKHVKVDLITEKLAPRRRAVMRIVGDVGTLTFAAIIAYKGFYLMEVAYKADRLTSGLEFPVYILMIVFPLGMTLFGLETLADILRTVKFLKGEKGSLDSTTAEVVY